MCKLAAAALIVALILFTVWRRRQRGPALRFKLSIDREEITMLQSMTVSQKQIVHAEAVDKDFKPVTDALDGKPEWSVAPEGVVSLFPSDDGFTCEVVALKEGTCQLNIRGDADKSTGVREITGFAAVEVKALGATSFVLTGETPVEQ